MAMPARMKATNEEIIAAYRETGSVWRAAVQLGMAGQSVHERLRKLGHSLPGERWSDDEIAELRRVAGSLSLSQIARHLGRPYGGVAEKISALGLAGRYRRRGPIKIPRGAGLDKQSVKRLARELHAYGGSLTSFCRLHGLRVELLVQAIQRHFPDEWETYTQTHAVAAPKVCCYCGREFYPTSGKQRACSRKCAADQRADRDYFGGNRRNTIGLTDGVCQLCGTQKARGLSAHHLIGKERDPGGQYLVALCTGCHQMVGHLANRKWTDDPERLESLIGLALIRRTGSLQGYHVFVDVEELGEDEGADEAAA